MAWFRRGDGSFKPGDEKEEEVEFKPEELKKEISTELTNKFGEFQTASDKKLEPLLEFVTTYNKDKEAHELAARQAKENKNKEDNELTEEDYLLDPIAATRRAMEPTQRALIAVTSRQLRKEILDEEPYYHTDIKSKVNTMIDNQPINVRTDPNVIKNCYKVVLFDYQKDIADGKIRAKNTSAIFEGGSTGAHGGKESGEDTTSLTDEEKRTAKIFNMSEADWKKSKAELTYV